jgi:CDP-diacylglycerol--glycerol-3-phosphate 3-phosphatidyltransferase
VLPASRGGKLKTLLEAVAIGLFLLPQWPPLHDAAWVVMIAAIVVAVVTGVDYVGRALSLRRRSAARAPAGAAVTTAGQPHRPA